VEQGFERILKELYDLLSEASQLGLPREAQWRLVRIIGMIEAEELEQVRRRPEHDVAEVARAAR
jgi:hypothetical protein